MSRILRPSFALEDMLTGPVCGIDEVGRGPLAGPVVAAAVTLDRARLPDDVAAAINDSKKLSEKKREYLFHKLHDYADISIAEIPAADIDRINILQATLTAMAKAFSGLKTIPTAALVDGNQKPKLPCTIQCVIGGDGKSLSIAAASIIAKHHRDKLMKTYAIEFPHYGWETNAGYGTAHHLKAIEIHGITPLHRLSFAPVRKYA